jgi:glycogen operon protein
VTTTAVREQQTSYVVSSGRPMPVGPTLDAGGANFSVYAEQATLVELLLFAGPGDVEPMQVVRLDPIDHRTFHFWHARVEGAGAGLHYAFRVHGPQDPGGGLRYDPEKVLIDPYGRANDHTLWSRGDACVPGDNLSTSLRSVLVDLDDYDWEGDTPLGRPMNETVIYEMHVAGFTRSPSAQVKAPGTYAGVIERIPYLQELGVTAVELLPVFDFDAADVLRTSPVDGTPLRNYWGYDPHAWFAPVGAYSSQRAGDDQVREFRDMVKALHRAGIEVILDVVFNHTAEGNEHGPTLCFKGFDNQTYYLLPDQDRSYYLDFSGCGNTVYANHPVTERMVADCLDHWVQHMHVDGFRFDEGSVLSRGADGGPMAFPPVIWRIELSNVLQDTKVIAEAWDAGGLYQVGSFPGARWGQWNGRYRDDVRDFVRGVPGLAGAVAARISGSADIYEAAHERPSTSINFVTAHDGFTLNDLVSYDVKHNEANGEGGRDGVDDNRSWNCGVEGPTDDPAVERLRERQVRNVAALLMLSQGVPMFVMGDEVRRGQDGNNNAYCQDNALTWFDWDQVQQHAGVLRFWQRMIAFRRAHPSLQRQQFFTGAVGPSGIPDVSWHGCALGQPGFDDPSCRVLALTLAGLAPGERDLHVIFNMESADLDFEVPPMDGRAWLRCIDTARPSPLDIDDEPTGGEPVTGPSVRVQAHSTVVLVAGELPVPASGSTNTKGSA